MFFRKNSSNDGQSDAPRSKKRSPRNRRKRTRGNDHGNAKHHIFHWEDSYDGETAHGWAYHARFYGLTVDVQPVERGPLSTYRTSIHKDKKYHKIRGTSIWKELMDQREKFIKEEKKLRQDRLPKLRRGKKVKNWTLERDAPHLYKKLRARANQ